MPTENVVGETINSFRSAQDLSSSEPAQLRRTIRELEARIGEQDMLIFQKVLYIEEQALRLARIEGQLAELEQARSKHCLRPMTDGLQMRIKMDALERENRYMEDLLADFADGFWALFENEKDRIREYLNLLGKMPATPETKSLYARVKKESQAILTARAQHKITPVNALKQLSELEEPVIRLILSRPTLTFTRSEVYRSEVLLENMKTTKAKCLTGPEAAKILSEREQKKIHREQASRAMYRAAALHPDRVWIERRRGGLRLVMQEARS